MACRTEVQPCSLTRAALRMTIGRTLAELRGPAGDRDPQCCAMTTTEAAILRHADGIYEHGGLLWRAKAGATSTFEKRVWAGAFYIELHRDAHWNPWRKEEEAADLDEVSMRLSAEFRVKSAE